MTDYSAPGFPLFQPVRRYRRVIVIMALSLLLHGLLLGWGADRLHLPQPHAAPQTVLETALLAPPTPPVAPAAPAPASKPEPIKPRGRPLAKPVPAAAPAATPVPDTDAATIAPTLPATSPDSAYSVPTEPLAPLPAATVGIGRSRDGAGTADGNDSATAAMPASASAVHYNFDPPPSATLKYDVEALREGQKVYGHGSIAWRLDGSRYSIAGDAGILFFSVLSFNSEGAIDEFGVAPVLYSEKRFRKAATNTHFQRERNLISFSASTTSYPRQGGEQDRASVIWQLASIGRGDSSRFVAGADIDLFVAGVRDAETWRIHVVGQELIDIDGAQTAAWHVLRAPRLGSYDQQIDIWLAPGQQWYPVKLRYTEHNGDYLDLLLSNLDRSQTAANAAPPAAENPASSHEWIN
jgi:hypothetical protein